MQINGCEKLLMIWLMTAGISRIHQQICDKTMHRHQIPVSANSQFKVTAPWITLGWGPRPDRDSDCYLKKAKRRSRKQRAKAEAELAWISLLLTENKDGRGRHVQIKRPQRREDMRTRFPETQRSRKTIPGTRNKILTIRFCQCDTMWHPHIGYNLMEGDCGTCVEKYMRTNVFMSCLLFLGFWHFLKYLSPK